MKRIKCSNVLPRHFLGLVLALGSVPGPAQSAPTAAKHEIPQVGTLRDGQYDFDFEIGTWKTHLRRLLHPLAGSTEWVVCDGTTLVRTAWDGRANLVELEADCPSGHFEAMSLRLYNPQSHQWSLNFANGASGTIGGP